MGQMDLYQQFKLSKIRAGEVSQQEDLVIKEFPLRIFLNQEQVVTLVCTPEHLDELAVGYLFSEGLISSKNEIIELQQKDDMVLIKTGDYGCKQTLTKQPAADRQKNLKHRIITSGCGRSIIYTDLSGSGLKKIRDQLVVDAALITEGVHLLSEQSELFKKTGGVHNALLFDRGKTVNLFREDIGRHNTVDKIIGRMVQDSIAPEQLLLIISGRISAEMVLKTVRRQIPILVSRSAPTDLALRLAYRLGLTVVGFARGKRMNVYTHPERVKSISGSLQG